MATQTPKPNRHFYQVTDPDKYKLLALTLGINEDNARKLVLNNYDSKDRPELIEKYLKQLE